MITLKNDQDRYTTVDGRHNRNNIQMIKKILDKKRDCKLVRQAQLIASRAALRQALLDGYRTLTRITIPKDGGYIDIDTDIKLPDNVVEAIKVVDKATSQAGYQF